MIEGKFLNILKELTQPEIVRKNFKFQAFSSRIAQLSSLCRMDFKEINFSSTPVKRIRFRGDSFQTENDLLMDNDNNDDVHSARNGEIPRERGLLTFFFHLLSKRHAISFSF